MGHLFPPVNDFSCLIANRIHQIRGFFSSPVAQNIFGMGFPFLGVIEYFSLLRYPKDIKDIHVYYLTLPLLFFWLYNSI